MRPQQHDVPVYVVLTMRSDYLGDCAQFTGLPEALNDSQFLVPRMTRAQLGAPSRSDRRCAAGGSALDSCNGSYTTSNGDGSPRELRAMGAQRPGSAAGASACADADVEYLTRARQRRRRRSICVYYEAAADRDAANTPSTAMPRSYQALPTDAHREVARSDVSATDRPRSENREVRRPTPLRELTAVALRARNVTGPAGHEALVNDVVAAFSAEGRAFLAINAQGDVESRTRVSSGIGSGCGNGCRRRRSLAAHLRPGWSRPRRAGNKPQGPSIEARSWPWPAAGGVRSGRPNSGPPV